MKSHKSFFSFCFLLIACFLYHETNAQYATKEINEIHQRYTDSLKQVDYNYVLPILGQEAYRKGFDIPYPVGFMGNFIWMRQNILLQNMQLGLQTDNVDIPLTPVDEVLQFGDNLNTSYAANLRPDVWILPFLNVYGIFGGGSSLTEVSLISPIVFETEVEQDMTTAGFGILGAGGIGPLWFTIDANLTWNKPILLDKPVRVSAIGFRLGHTVKFKTKPQSNVAFWFGTMRVAMDSETTGEIELIEALPPSVWERRDEIVDNYYDWYENEATPPQRKIADEVLTPIVERLEQADGSAVIRYSMDKQVAEKWNGIIGAQYQINKRWMIRSEGGVIGNRTSFYFSVNYRLKI